MVQLRKHLIGLGVEGVEEPWSKKWKAINWI